LTVGLAHRVWGDSRDRGLYSESRAQPTAHLRHRIVNSGTPPGLGGGGVPAFVNPGAIARDRRAVQSQYDDRYLEGRGYSLTAESFAHNIDALRVWRCVSTGIGPVARTRGTVRCRVVSARARGPGARRRGRFRNDSGRTSRSTSRTLLHARFHPTNAATSPCVIMAHGETSTGTPTRTRPPKASPRPFVRRLMHRWPERSVSVGHRRGCIGDGD
jgi:hypothetical protein